MCDLPVHDALGVQVHDGSEHVGQQRRRSILAEDEPLVLA